jgi:diadenosine tetraphosphate (Ap4A) HIT family hydrolase
MPDKFPIGVGHTLIVSKPHLACYGAAESEALQELESATADAQRYVAEAFGKPVMIWENGVAGQSVFHAHLHLIPLDVPRLPPEFHNHPDVTPISDWSAVQRHFATHGHYRYLQIGAARWLLHGHSPIMGTVGRLISDATGLRRGPSGWIKTTTPDDVAEVGRRFADWQARGLREASELPLRNREHL